MHTIVIAVAALIAMSLIPTAASAEWYCLAKSRTGSWGEGWSPVNGTARGIALGECAVRTPRGFVCVITSCVRR